MDKKLEQLEEWLRKIERLRKEKLAGTQKQSGWLKRDNSFRIERLLACGFEQLG